MREKRVKINEWIDGWTMDKQMTMMDKQMKI